MDRAQLQVLVQADLDGELSAAERADLARLLLRDPEARRLHSEYRQTDQLLRDIPEAEPPPGLRAAILAGPGASLPGRTGDARHWHFGRPLYRVAAAVLGGILIVGMTYLLRDADAPRTDLQGSLGAAGSPVTTGSIAPEDHLSMRANDFEINASLRRDGSRLRLELHTSTMIPCEIIARIDPARTTLVGTAGGAHMNTSSDQVSVQLAIGRQDLVLDFFGAAPIHLELRSQGQLLGEGRLSVGDR